MSSQAIPIKYVNAKDYELNHERIEKEEIQLHQRNEENERNNTISAVPLNNNIKSSKNNESESSKVTTITQPQQQQQQYQPQQQQQENQRPADVVTTRKSSSSASDILASIENQLNIIMPLSKSSKVVTEKLIEFDETAPASEAEDELKPLIIDNHNPVEKPLTTTQFNANAPVFSPSYRTQLLLADKRDSMDSNCSEDTNKMYLSHSPVGSVPDVLEIDTIEPSEMPSDLFSESSLKLILKDAFLLKHVRRNKEGFVSLKLVSSFKRVRQLTKDWRVVGQAIRKKGRRIELNDICTKIRRIEPLPNFDETMPSRTIVACDLPLDKLTIEKVSDMFSQCGEIALIRILKPGMGIPVDVRQFMNKYPEMQEKECALVEFIESNSARNAKNLPYQVYDMVAPKKKTGRKMPNGNAPEGRMTKMIETYKAYEHPHHNYERNRGGSFSAPHNSPPTENKYIQKYQQNHHHNHYNPYQQVQLQQQAAQHIFQRNNSSYNMGDNYNRRFSNGSVTMLEDRRFSSCSEGYSSCSDMSRRPSGYSTDESRRNSAACSDMHCSCGGSRRPSQCSERLSNGSDYGRRFSNGNTPHQLERSYSNPTTEAFLSRRKDSLDSSYDRKLSVGSQGSMCESLNSFHNFQNYRKCSNGFDRKMSNDSHFINGRRLSSDSGYDRRMSFGSDSENYGSPRSRANSFLTTGSQHKCTDNIVRSPMGPDGSKGFASRARKFGQIVPPV
uniref:HTH La-type RNA-binding domain-containing protein n=1 Tax=Megaselia scalaris TaxID=36166 RepID=T1GRQ0_MEGSC